MGVRETVLFLRLHLRLDFFVSFLLFLLSQKKKQEKPDGKRKKKKGSAVSLGVLEKRLFRIKCSDRFSSLRRDCGTNPVRKSDSTGFAGLLRWWAEVVRPLRAERVAVIACGHSRLRSFAHGFVKIVRV